MVTVVSKIVGEVGSLKKLVNSLIFGSIMPELLSRKRGRSIEEEVESEIHSRKVFLEDDHLENVEQITTLESISDALVTSNTSCDTSEQKKVTNSKKKKTLTPEAAALLALKNGLTSCVPTSDFPKALLLVKEAIASGMVPTAHFYGILLNIATRATRLEP